MFTLEERQKAVIWPNFILAFIIPKSIGEICQRRIKNNVKRRLKIDANAGICYRRLPFRRNVCSRCRLDTGFCSVF